MGTTGPACSPAAGKREIEASPPKGPQVHPRSLMKYSAGSYHPRLQDWYSAVHAGGRSNGYFAATGPEPTPASFPDLPIATAETEVQQRMMENSHAANRGGTLLVNARRGNERVRLEMW